MLSTPIVALGDSAAVVVPLDVLKSVGLKIGDAVEITSGDRQLILKAAPDPTHRRMIEKITDELLIERRDAYERLA